jgi:hypothetical protein
MRALTLAAACLLLSGLPAERATADSAVLPDPVEGYIALAIQGDLSGVPEWLSQFPPERFPQRLELEQAFLDRFSPATGQTTGGIPGLPERIAVAYEVYWRKALLEPREAGDSERSLFAELGTLLDSDPAAETVRNILEKALAGEGVHVFEGPTPPLRDLFLWRRQESHRFEVQLTDGPVEVTVHFMDDFLAQGWKDFASLGLATTTGWVENGELYCLAWAYDTGSENFDVSYLRHEARHLEDLERYPEMDATELEYRAKLTELAFANRTLHRILEDFTDKAAENPASPHAMANWRVMRDIYWQLHGEEMPGTFDSWSGVRVGQVNRAARILLDTSNGRMRGRE